jgi:hypothetical protein
MNENTVSGRISAARRRDATPGDSIEPTDVQHAARRRPSRVRLPFVYIVSHRPPFKARQYSAHLLSSGL